MGYRNIDLGLGQDKRQIAAFILLAVLLIVSIGITVYTPQGGYAKTPDFLNVTIKGPTILGVNQTGVYSASVNNSYSGSLEYIWTISPQDNSTILTPYSSSPTVIVGETNFFADKCNLTFTNATTTPYVLSVQAKDLQIGNLGSASIVVSDPYTQPTQYLGAVGLPYSYLVQTDGLGWYEAIQGTTGAIAFTSTNCSYVINSVWALGPSMGNGLSMFITPGEYYIDSPLLRATSGRLTVIGSGPTVTEIVAIREFNGYMIKEAGGGTVQTYQTIFEDFDLNCQGPLDTGYNITTATGGFDLTGMNTPILTDINVWYAGSNHGIYCNGYVGYSSGVTMYDVDVADCVSDGVYLQDAYAIKITMCESNQNTGYGWNFQGGGEATMIGVDADQDQNGGFVFASFSRSNINIRPTQDMNFGAQFVTCYGLIIDVNAQRCPYVGSPTWTRALDVVSGDYDNTFTVNIGQQGSGLSGSTISIQLSGSPEPYNNTFYGYIQGTVVFDNQAVAATNTVDVTGLNMTTSASLYSQSSQNLQVISLTSIQYNATYQVNCWLNVNSITSGGISINMGYTYINGTSEGTNCLFLKNGGTVSNQVTTATFYPCVSFNIEAKAGTNIWISVQGTFSASYDVGVTLTCIGAT